MSDLHKLDNTELLLKALDLEEKVEQFEIERIAVRKAIRQLDSYVVVQNF